MIVVASIRPDWSELAIQTALFADDRPWRTVVLASIAGAANPDTRHPNGLRYANPTNGANTQTYPSATEALNPQLDHHGFTVGACPMCRRGMA